MADPILFDMDGVVLEAASLRRPHDAGTEDRPEGAVIELESLADLLER